MSDVIEHAQYSTYYVLFYSSWLMASRVHVTLDGQEQIALSTSLSVAVILVSMEEPAL